MLFSSEHSEQCKHPIEKSTGIGHQELLAVHGQGGDEDLGGGEAAPADPQYSQQGSQDASVDTGRYFELLHCCFLIGR